VSERPALVAVAHGTRDGRDTPAVRALLRRVAALRPGLTVREAYLQFADPLAADSLAAAGDAVAVPLLLSPGYHVRADLPQAVAAAATASGRAPARIAAVLGPDPLLTEALVGRLGEAGWVPGDPVVLAAAGSSDPAAIATVRTAGRLLAEATGSPVTAAFAAAAEPSIVRAVADLRAAHPGRIAVASYLIAAGHFHDLAAAAGADLVAGPLADHPALARLVLARYDAALAARPAPGAEPV
jgi:sirohydrochlorin ferrochelatase